jgi:hypothetical protein
MPFFENPDTSVATDVVIKPGMTGAGTGATEWEGRPAFVVYDSPWLD